MRALEISISMNMQANYASGHCTSPIAFEVKYIKESHKIKNKKL